MVLAVVITGLKPGVNGSKNSQTFEAKRSLETFEQEFPIGEIGIRTGPVIEHLLMS
jgi:hypothetical protein